MALQTHHVDSKIHKMHKTQSYHPHNATHMRDASQHLRKANRLFKKTNVVHHLPQAHLSAAKHHDAVAQIAHNAKDSTSEAHSLQLAEHHRLLAAQHLATKHLAEHPHAEHPHAEHPHAEHPHAEHPHTDGAHHDSKTRVLPNDDKKSANATNHIKPRTRHDGTTLAEELHGMTDAVSDANHSKLTPDVNNAKTHAAAIPSVTNADETHSNIHDDNHSSQMKNKNLNETPSTLQDNSLSAHDRGVETQPSSPPPEEQRPYPVETQPPLLPRQSTFSRIRDASDSLSKATDSVSLRTAHSVGRRAVNHVMGALKIGILVPAAAALGSVAQVQGNAQNLAREISSLGVSSSDGSANSSFSHRHSHNGNNNSNQIIATLIPVAAAATLIPVAAANNSTPNNTTDPAGDVSDNNEADSSSSDWSDSEEEEGPR